MLIHHVVRTSVHQLHQRIHGCINDAFSSCLNYVVLSSLSRFHHYALEQSMLGGWAVVL